MLNKLVQFSLEMNRIMAGPTGVKVGDGIMRVFKGSIWMMAFGFATTLAILASDSRWLYNSTWSVDKGLYHIDRTKRHSFARGDVIAFNYVAPAWVRERGWTHIPDFVKMIKPVAAIPGDRVTVKDGWLWVCKQEETACSATAWRSPTDRHGVAWPEWDAPQVIPEDHYLVIAPFIASYDSRYWGLVPTSAILGKASPVWTRRLAPERANPEVLQIGSMPPVRVPEAPENRRWSELQQAGDGGYHSLLSLAVVTPASLTRGSMTPHSGPSVARAVRPMTGAPSVRHSLLRRDHLRCSN